MRFRRVILLLLVICVAGVVLACLWREGAAQTPVRFTRYASYSSGIDEPELAKKTAAFFLISNPGPQTAVLYGGMFAWSSHPYLSAQVQREAHWTNAEPVPAPGFPCTGLRLAAGEYCEVPVLLGTRLLGPRPDMPMPKVGTNQTWRVGFQIGFDGPFGPPRHWQTIWSDPVIAR
jgi:hypothetical protein